MEGEAEEIMRVGGTPPNQGALPCLAWVQRVPKAASKGSLIWYPLHPDVQLLRTLCTTQHHAFLYSKFDSKVKSMALSVCW